jgi:hypothetical protein
MATSLRRRNFCFLLLDFSPQPSTPRPSTCTKCELLRALVVLQWHLHLMPHRPPRTKKPRPASGESENRQFRSAQLANQRRQELAARSTLSRLRNRKSDLK